MSSQHREGWPNVILESLACGTPVVATQRVGYRRYSIQRDLGLLTERDEGKIANAIVAALGKKWISEQLLATREITGGIVLAGEC